MIFPLFAIGKKNNKTQGIYKTKKYIVDGKLKISN